MEKCGKWSWFLGSDEIDDEMLDCGTREEAIAEGKRQHGTESFYIVEARFTERDEKAMARGEIDCAPFAETRNGEFVRGVAKQ